MDKNELKLGLNKINQLNQNDFETLLTFFNLNEKININDFMTKFNQEFINRSSSFSKNDFP